MVLRNASWTSPDPLTEDNFEEAVNFKSDVTFNSCKKSTVTLNGSGNVAVTGVLSSPSAVTVSGSLTYSDSSTSTTLVLTNTKVTVSNIAPDYDMSNATIFIEYGTLQATIAGENSLLRFKNFTVGLASIPTGTMATLSGQIRSGCLETWLTVSTTSPVTILNGETCPTEGIVSASYNGNTIRAVIASAPPQHHLVFQRDASRHDL